MLKVDYTTDEKIIAEAIIEARKVQEYLWDDISLLYYPYDVECFRRVFQKRVDKISEIKSINGTAKVELRKRLLQQAALSIVALRILDDAKS